MTDNAKPLGEYRDNEDVETEVEAPDPKEFDLLGVLAGRDLPEEVVPICVDESGAYTLSKLNDEIRKYELISRADDPGNAEEVLSELMAHRERVLEGLRELTFTFKFKGILKSARKNLREEAFKKYPEPKNLDKRPNDPNQDKRDEYFRTILIASHLKSITDPHGAVFDNITPEYVQEMMDALPEHSAEQVVLAVAKFQNATHAGFEAAAKSTDFLS